MSQSRRVNTIFPSEEYISWHTPTLRKVTKSVLKLLAMIMIVPMMIIFFLTSDDSVECREVFKVYNEQLMEV